MLFSVLFVCILPWSILSQLSTTTDTTELFATVAPGAAQFIEDSFLPEDYELSSNIYEWNVSEIVFYINQSNPDLLYSVDTKVLLLIFPEYFISQLPRDILVAHGLYQYLDVDDALYCFNMTNCTASTIADTSSGSACLEPFVATKYEGWFECMCFDTRFLSLSECMSMFTVFVG